MLEQLQSACGLILLLAVAWLLSERREIISFRLPLIGVVLQIFIALLLLKIEITQQFLAMLNLAVITLQQAAQAGSAFVFGYLGGAPLPFETAHAGAAFVLAFQALPLVILISALTALLTYWRILPLIVKGLASVLRRTLGIGGAVGFGTAANIFVGMIEAPLFIRDYLLRLSRSELFMIMTAGMSTIAGTVLVLYATFISDLVPNAVGHLLIASLISAPAALVIAYLMVPDNNPSLLSEPQALDISGADSSMDAITRGTLEGLRLYLNIIAMLLVFVALVYIANSVLSLLPDIYGQKISLERILGYLMMPLVWCMGIPWNEAMAAGELMGIKTVLNELLAYLRLAALAPETLSPRSELIMTYALCGFANFGSLGIMIGGLTTLAPQRRSEIVALGLRSIVSGTLATCSTGAVIGMLTTAS